MVSNNGYIPFTFLMTNRWCSFFYHMTTTFQGKTFGSPGLKVATDVQPKGASCWGNRGFFYIYLFSWTIRSKTPTFTTVCLHKKQQILSLVPPVFTRNFRVPMPQQGNPRHRGNSVRNLKRHVRYRWLPSQPQPRQVLHFAYMAGGSRESTSLLPSKMFCWDIGGL